MNSVGVKEEDISYIIVTHVHLDHAGGAGALMQKCPNAMFICHERGARHMIDPTALLAGSTAVYGNDFMEKNYLPVIGIPKERVISITAKEEHFTTGEGFELRICQAPGHAPHHIGTTLFICDEKSENKNPTICEGYFTGDSFAAEYPVERNHTRKATKVYFLLLVVVVIIVMILFSLSFSLIFFELYFSFSSNLYHIFYFF